MSDRFENRADVAAHVDWEGGVLAAVDEGTTGDHMPEGDVELTAAWDALTDSYAATDDAADAVRKLLERAA